MVARTSVVLGVAMLMTPAAAEQAPSAVTIDDLVQRTHIVLAALSPDARYTAYVMVRGNPVDDTYTLTVGIADSLDGSRHDLSRYVLPGSRVFGAGWFRASAGALYWASAHTLLFTERENGNTRLMCWDARTGERSVALGGYDEVILQDTDRVESELAIETSSTLLSSTAHGDAVPDAAWRLQDADFFYRGRAANPETASLMLKRSWSLSVDADGKIIVLAKDGGVEQRAQQEWFQARALSSPEIINRYSPVPSASRRRTVFVSTAEDPRSATTGRFAIVEADQSGERILVPALTRYRPVLWPRTVLGWKSENGPIYFIEVDAEKSAVFSVTRNGVPKEIVHANALFETPCMRFLVGRRCQVISSDGRFALLIRTTNTVPDELVRIDLETGAIETVAAPNESFKAKEHVSVRFYRIENLHGAASGRLYLPDAMDGGPYPLVITQYHSNPGFYTSSGDEFPLLPLVANGIAVFAMNSLDLNVVPTDGDFRKELWRVERPLEGMRWVVDALARARLIDPQRVGVCGLSYGSEIAMYGYWKSDLFAAVSSAAASWEPQSSVLFGPDAARAFRARGLVSASGSGDLSRWRRLSAGLNARPTLPPLLIQSADGERNSTLPAWTALRLADAAVEWFEYPEAETGHVKWRPANKWWVYTRNADWFRFWLQGYQSAAAEKADQYGRWREMRSRRCGQLRSQANAPWYCRGQRDR